MATACESLLALLPLVLALAWTIGLMHLFGIRFNLANIWGLPMILGISAEFGLNVMFRYLEGRAYGGPLLARSTVLGVVLNGLTTIVGFGSLLIAAHRGIFSLGLLLTIGCACGLVASLIVLPIALRLITPTSAPMTRELLEPEAVREQPAPFSWYLDFAPHPRFVSPAHVLSAGIGAVALSSPLSCKDFFARQDVASRAITRLSAGGPGSRGSP